MKIKTFISYVIVAALGAGIVFGLQKTFPDDNQAQLHAELTKVPTQAVNYPLPTDNSISFTDAAERTIDAVVHVKTLTTGTSAPNDLYNFFFGNPYLRNTPRQAAGSGVIISSDGYIVTNNHVIENADKISVTLNNNREYPAKLIGSDPATDIALIKIEDEELPVIAYGDSDDLKVGEWVLAVGNPFNLTSTVTAGIVSAKARNINILQERYAVEAFIQTDAAVNPGNSGGALVNTSGELVGINTAIASQTGSFSGYSFAVPVNIVKKIVADLMEYGTVQRAMLGVSIGNIDSDLADKLELDDTEGVYVMGVSENSAAKDAGILAEDILLKINERKIKNVPELQEQISKYRPGDVIEVILRRGGKLKKLSVTLKNSAGNTEIVQKNDIAVLGAEFAPVSSADAQKLGINSGVQVTEIRSGKLLKSGVREGFIITQMNRRKINNVEDIILELNHSQGGIYLEGIYPNGTTAYYAFGLK